jgi:formylglycine-generating enzyme required for sulfatase activity
MKRLFCLALVVAVVTLASDLSGSVVPDRKPLGKQYPPEGYTNSIAMKFVWIPPGTFMMGSPKEEKGRYDFLELQHKVTLTKGFYMGVYSVAQEEW